MSNIKILDSSKTAILVIDVQRALFTRPEPVYNASGLVETINSLVSRAQLFGVRIVYVQHANQSILKKGSDGWKLHPGLKPTARDLIIDKEVGNTFTNHMLLGDFEARGIQNVLITGLVTNQCVQATSLGGLKLGLKVFLIQGAHSNFDRDPVRIIETTELKLAEAGVNLVTVEEIGFS